MESPDLRELPGLVATVCTTGAVTPQYAASLSNLRDHNSRTGFVHVEYQTFDAKLVESGRDAVCLHALQNKYAYLLMIDADAVFPQDAHQRLLHTAFVRAPGADVVGAYANLKNAPYLPTIDTGTGTWEVWYPGSGLLSVIRTGGHMLLVKTPLLTRMGPPWFRTRIPATPIRAMRDLDNFARTQLDGKNPLRDHPEWDTLFAQAAQASAPAEAASIAIGEDSGFCDNAHAHGATILVDTDVVTGHVGSRVIDFRDLRKEIKDMDKRVYASVGVRDYE